MIAALAGTIVIPSLLSVGKLSVSGRFLLLHTGRTAGAGYLLLFSPSPRMRRDYYGFC
jgi:hypothetical protein